MRNLGAGWGVTALPGLGAAEGGKGRKAKKSKEPLLKKKENQPPSRFPFFPAERLASPSPSGPLGAVNPPSPRAPLGTQDGGAVLGRGALLKKTRKTFKIDLTHAKAVIFIQSRLSAHLSKSFETFAKAHCAIRPLEAVSQLRTKIRKPIGLKLLGTPKMLQEPILKGARQARLSQSLYPVQAPPDLCAMA